MKKNILVKYCLMCSMSINFLPSVASLHSPTKLSPKIKSSKQTQAQIFYGFKGRQEHFSAIMKAVEKYSLFSCLSKKRFSEISSLQKEIKDYFSIYTLNNDGCIKEILFYYVDIASKQKTYIVVETCIKNPSVVLEDFLEKASGYPIKILVNTVKSNIELPIGSNDAGFLVKKNDDSNFYIHPLLLSNRKKEKNYIIEDNYFSI